MSFVEDLASLSTCKRAQVGAIVIPPNYSQIYSIGYNGPPRGTDNSSCTNRKGECGCVHAEANAMIKLRAEVEGLTLLTTTSPCVHCAGLIINDGRIDRVVYLKAYREKKGLILLDNSGILCYSYETYYDRLRQRR